MRRWHPPRQSQCGPPHRHAPWVRRRRGGAGPWHRRYRRRLYLQIYLAFVGVALACVMAAGAAQWLGQPAEAGGMVSAAAEVVVESLPAEGPLTPTLQQRADALGLHLQLLSAEGAVLADAGFEQAVPLPSQPPEGEHFGLSRVRGRMVAVVPLPDGRWLAGRWTDGARRKDAGRHLLTLWAVVCTAAAGCYPLARRITRRLERLQRGVERLGAGTLSARVPVDGDDEIAEMARAFNGAAARIEQLVSSQRRMLASASHELRSPLTRLRMGIDLIPELPAGPERERALAAARREIAELDALIGDLLLAARLESEAPSPEPQPVELLALVAEEAARVGAEVGGQPTTVPGQPRMLRRLFRNLLENARRYAGDPIEAHVESGAAGARVIVADRGPGVPESERERIFEPFYRPGDHHEGAHGGVGLGLSLVRSIALHHGGGVEVRPRSGGGSEFVLTLPAT